MLINPSQVTLRYVDQNGNELQPSDTYVGDNLTDYKAMSNPSMSPLTFADAYYQPGMTRTFAAPDITGYITPAEQSSTFSVGSNTVTFVYHVLGAATTEPSTPAPVVGAAAGSAGGNSALANTGTAIGWIVSIALALVAASAAAGALRRLAAKKA